MNKNEIVIFETEDNAIKLKVPVECETVWLNRQQMSELFNRDVKTIGKHINNALREELDGQVVVAKFATTTQHGAIKILKANRKLSKFFIFYSIIVITGTLFCSISFVAKDPLSVVNNLSDFIFSLIRAIGLIWPRFRCTKLKNCTKYTFF